MSPALRPADRDEFLEMVATLRGRDGYREPRAFGIGTATFADADGAVLDSWYPVVNLDQNLGSAAIVSDVVGHDGGAATYELTPEQLAEILARFAPMLDDGDDHPNLRVLAALASAQPSAPSLPVRTAPIVTFLADLDDGPGRRARRLPPAAPALAPSGRAARPEPRRPVRPALERRLDQRGSVRRRVVRGRPGPSACRRHGGVGALGRQVPAHGRLRHADRCPHRRRGSGPVWVRTWPTARR